jgi:L-lactate dehydrogenase complex protein LldG
MDSSRTKILAAVKQNQGECKPLPVVKSFSSSADRVQKFTEILKSIGGQVYSIRSYSEVEDVIHSKFGKLNRVVSLVGEVSGTEENQARTELASLHDVDLFITQATLGVAENGAVWLEEKNLYERVLPFIAQHVVVILGSENIVPTMHEAYEKIGNTDYGFAAFIAGPSKTADIEQSLVLGAHGAMTMTVFIKND